MPSVKLRETLRSSSVSISINPVNNLVFNTESPPRADIRILNHRKDKLAYKIKATSRDEYTLKNRQGFLDGYQEVVASIHFVGRKDQLKMPLELHKFLIKVKRIEKNEDFDQIWQSTSEDDIKKILKVEFAKKTKPESLKPHTKAGSIIPKLKNGDDGLGSATRNSRQSSPVKESSIVARGPPMKIESPTGENTEAAFDIGIDGHKAAATETIRNAVRNLFSSPHTSDRFLSLGRGGDSWFANDKVVRFCRDLEREYVKKSEIISAKNESKSMSTTTHDLGGYLMPFGGHEDDSCSRCPKILTPTTSNLAKFGDNDEQSPMLGHEDCYKDINASAGNLQTIPSKPSTIACSGDRIDNTTNNFKGTNNATTDTATSTDAQVRNIAAAGEATNRATGKGGDGGAKDKFKDNDDDDMPKESITATIRRLTKERNTYYSEMRDLRNFNHVLLVLLFAFTILLVMAIIIYYLLQPPTAINDCPLRGFPFLNFLCRNV